MKWLPNSVTRGLALMLLVTYVASAHAAERALDGPDVTIISGEQRTVYEYRQNGHLRMVKVVPKFGRPYYLTPRDGTRGYGDLERADMLLPTWVIVEF